MEALEDCMCRIPLHKAFKLDLFHISLQNLTLNDMNKSYKIPPNMNSQSFHCRNIDICLWVLPPVGKVHKITAHASYHPAKVWKVLNSNTSGPKDFG